MNTREENFSEIKLNLVYSWEAITFITKCLLRGSPAFFPSNFKFDITNFIQTYSAKNIFEDEEISRVGCGLDNEKKSIV